MRSELESNALANLQMTLRDFASLDRQVAYKSAVPFVHVPIELLEQWSSHSRTLREAGWFRALFTQVQLAKLADFDATVSLNKKLLGKRVPDVPEIFSVPAWLAMVEAAASTIAFVPSSDDLHDRDGS